MAKVKTGELERIGAGLQALGTHLLTNARDIARSANDHADDGIQGVRYDRQGGSSEPHSDPVGGRVLRDRWDPVRHEEDRFVTLLRDMEVAGKEAFRRSNGFLPLTIQQAQVLAKGGDLEEETYQAICANPNCGRDVAGTPNDRIRAGRCTPCYAYRQRNGLERPRELCQPEPEAEAV